MQHKDLKIGDKILLVRGLCAGENDGRWAIIKELPTDFSRGDSYKYDVFNSSGQPIGESSCHDCIIKVDIKLISNNTIMNILEKFKLLGLNEPEKTFRKLGIQDDKGQLTSEGRALYDSWRFEQDKTAFKTNVCEPLLAEMEAEKK